jgi:hypothetical protein
MNSTAGSVGNPVWETQRGPGGAVSEGVQVEASTQAEPQPGSIHLHKHSLTGFLTTQKAREGGTKAPGHTNTKCMRLLEGKTPWPLLETRLEMVLLVLHQACIRCSQQAEGRDWRLKSTEFLRQAGRQRQQ